MYASKQDAAAITGYAYKVGEYWYPVKPDQHNDPQSPQKAKVVYRYEEASDPRDMEPGECSPVGISRTKSTAPNAVVVKSSQ